MKKRNVIHIGLPKAGSTSLQFLLRRNNDIAYYHHEAMAWDKRRWLEVKAEWSSEAPVVVSHEGLGCSDRAAFLYEIMDAPIVVVVTRNPIDWLCSYYKHQVCKGEYRLFEGWLKAEYKKLSRSVDYERGAKFWKERFGVYPVFVPMERLVRDSLEYTDLINSLIGYEFVSSDKSDQILNKSIDSECAEIVRAFNETMRTMVDNHNAYGGKILGNLKGLRIKYPEISGYFIREDGRLNLDAIGNFIGVITKSLIQSVPENQALLKERFGGAGLWIDRFLALDALGSVVDRNQKFLSQLDHYKPVLEHYGREI